MNKGLHSPFCIEPDEVGATGRCVCDMTWSKESLFEYRKLQTELNEAISNEGAKDLRIDDLEKALFRYGQHEGGCPAWGRPRPDLCTCGYVTAFKGTYGNHHWVRGKTYVTTDELCPHGFVRAENVCGPCSEGRPNGSQSAKES